TAWAGPHLPSLSRDRRMTHILVRKLLRDVRTSLIIVAVLLLAFQLLWAKVTENVSGQLLLRVEELTKGTGLQVDAFINTFFEGPGKIIQKLIGGEGINIRKAFDLLSSG